MAKKHTTKVTKVSFDQLREEYAARALDRARERFFPTEDRQNFQGLADKVLESAVDELLKGHYAEGGSQEGAWAAHCSCGWAANNPVPTEEVAEEAADAHLTAIYGDD